MNPGGSAHEESGLDKPVFTVVLPATKKGGELGTGFGDRTSSADERAVAQEVAGGRILSESTNSSM
jgi:hypothetical protein